MDFLKEIIAQKSARLARARETISLEELRERAHEARRDAAAHRLYAALQDLERINIIAEFKRASPSKGLIRAGAQPAEIARSYEAGGAAAISVLTEGDRFQGSLEDLKAVREAVTLPLLRKDFIFDEFQVYETAAAGADALLLIVAALDDETLARLRRLTEDELGMDALIEVHTEEEMRRATGAGARLVGVNNRDLRTFKVSLDVSVELANFAESRLTLVSESGLKTNEDLEKLRALGFKAFLIGETLMRADQPEDALRALINEEGEKGKRGKG